MGILSRISIYLLYKREKRLTKKIGGHIATYEEAEQAYRDGKIVNLVEYCPEVFGDNGN